jgi:effector-binding domain-containing protein
MPDVLELQSALIAGVRAEIAAAEVGEFFGRAMGEVASAVPVELFAGPMVAVYHRDDGDRFNVTVGMTVSAAPDARGITVVELPAGPGLRETHRGPYPGLSSAYQALRDELARRGQPWTFAWERYVVGPGDASDAADYVTELITPLA